MAVEDSYSPLPHNMRQNEMNGNKTGGQIKHLSSRLEEEYNPRAQESSVVLPKYPKSMQKVHRRS